jgi:hypothetical protein
VKTKPKKKAHRAPKRSRPTKTKKAIRRKKPTPVPKGRRRATPKVRRRVAPKVKRKPAVRKRAAKAKGAPKPKRAATARKSSSKGKQPPSAPPRRDATGHLAAGYAADLRARSKESAPSAEASSFLSGSKSSDPLAEELGEEFVKTAVSGEDTAEEATDEVLLEESGGPFVETSAQTEFASGTDASNPKGAKKEPFPTT